MHASDYVSGQVNPHVDKSITNVLSLSFDWLIRVIELWFELTSTSKLTSSPSRKTIVQTRPFLMGSACWCFPIEWILPFELSKLGRNFEFGWWWLASSVNAVAEVFVCRRLKKRMNRAAAINQVPWTSESDVNIIKTIIILKKQNRQRNDVIIESTRRSSTACATPQTECIVHRSIIRGEGERETTTTATEKKERNARRLYNDGRGTVERRERERIERVRYEATDANLTRDNTSYQKRERDVYRWWGV